MTATFVPLLHEFSATLADYERRHPHLPPFEVLRESEGVAAVLSPQAADAWDEVLRQSPDDALALHHLAVIHHGTAYQLHFGAGKAPSAAVPHWKRALELWGTLIGTDSFWDRLRTVWDERHRASKGDLLAERLLTVDLGAFRRQLPAHLLSVHATIVQETWRTNPPLAAEHLKLIRTAPLPQGVVEQTIAGLYGLLVGDVGLMCTELRFDDARQALERFLQIDPDNVRALCDLLQVLCRECDRIGGDSGAFARREKLMESGRPWAERLVRQGDPQRNLFASDALRDYYVGFALLYKIEGDGFGNRKEFGRAGQLLVKAFEQAEKALQYERAGQRAAQIYQVTAAEAALFNTSADNEAHITERVLRSAMTRFPNSALLHALRGFHHLRQGDRDGFTRDLDQAERLNRANPDPEATSLIANLRQAAQGATGSAHMNRAIQALQREDFATARTAVKAAEAESGQTAFTQALLAACCLRTTDVLEAIEAYKTAKRLNRTERDPNATELLRQLDGVLGQFAA